MDELVTGQEEIKNMIKDLKKELRGLIEINKRLIHERLGVPNPAPPTEYGEDQNRAVTKTKIIEVNDFSSDRICVLGNTYDYREAIKSAGQAKWESSSKAWSLPKDSLAQLIENFRQLDLEQDVDFTVSVTRSEEGGFGSDFN